MNDALINFAILLAVAAIACVIIRQMRPPRKLAYGAEALVCISSGKVFGDERLYFNSQGICVYCGEALQAQYRFEDVLALQKSGVAVNGVKVWRLAVQRNGATVAYRFRPDVALWRDGFSRFYSHLQAVRPESVKSKWRRWAPGW